MSDLIERDKVIEYCLKLIDVERKQGSDVMNYGQERINQTDTIIAFVENLPSARPKGDWVSEGRIYPPTNGYHGAVCSICGTESEYLTNFCGECGADMRKTEPQTCETCKWGEWYRKGYDITMMDDECGGCCSWRSKWTPNDEPQTEREDE